MKKFLLLLAFTGLLAVPGSAEKIDLTAGKSVHIVLPDSWTSVDLPGPQPDLPAMGRNVRYATRNGSNDAVLITILLVPDERFRDSENLKVVVEQATAQFVAGSVEGKAEIKELRLGGMTGFAATFTDASLVGKPSVKEDYKAMTSCFVYLGARVLVTATVFTDDLAGKAYADGMRILKSLSLDLPKDSL